MKDHDDLARLDAEAATARIDTELAEMYPESPNPWLDLGLQDFDSRNQQSDPRTDFISAWDAVESPYLLGSFVKEAARLAAENPLDLGVRFSRTGDALLRGLVSLCYWLGQRSTDGEFFLSCRDAGEALDVSPQTANQLLRRAGKLGFIEPAATYSEKDRARRDAKKWRFVALTRDTFPVPFTQTDAQRTGPATATMSKKIGHDALRTGAPNS
ncbi:MAG TPA: hypothetical protein DD490_29520 [Acidobacteria bacterium]|nr:hypothetical protein [Acidobacteriota bacterium]